MDLLNSETSTPLQTEMHIGEKMSSTRVPEKISNLNLAILNCVKAKKAVTSSEICDELSDWDRSTVQKQISNLQINGFLKTHSGTGRGKKIAVAKRGSDTIAQIDTVEVFAYKKNPNKSKPHNKNNTAPQPTQDLIPTLNISNTANQIADQISQLLDQNNGYRSFLTRIRDQINQILGEDITEHTTYDSEGNGN